MKSLQHQKGMTAIGWMLVLGLIAFFTLVTLRLVPVYLESNKVASVLESLKKEPGITKKSRSQIIALLNKRFDVNDIRKVDPGTAKITRDKGVLKVQIAWERREHLFANIDLVSVFDKQIEVVAN